MIDRLKTDAALIGAACIATAIVLGANISMAELVGLLAHMR